MPNQRAAGQKAVIVVMKEDFLDKIDGNLERMGFGDRAAFIRAAVAEKLREEGVDVQQMEITPPSRAGKGGRKKKADPTYGTVAASPVQTENREKFSRFSESLKVAEEPPDCVKKK